jgi:hypothetical protein
MPSYKATKTSQEKEDFATMAEAVLPMLDAAVVKAFRKFQKSHGHAPLKLCLFAIESALVLSAVKISLRRRAFDQHLNINADTFADMASDAFKRGELMFANGPANSDNTPPAQPSARSRRSPSRAYPR